MTDLHLVFVGDGRRLPVTNMFDIDGEPTDIPARAFTCVARLPDGQWLATECGPGDLRADGQSENTK